MFPYFDSENKENAGSAGSIVWVGSSTDPLVSITERFSGVTLQQNVPSGAYAVQAQDDKVAAFIRADHLVSQDLDQLQVDANGRTLLANGNWIGEGTRNVDLKGTGWGLSAYGASNHSAIAGVIRVGELGTNIPHALRIVVQEHFLNPLAPANKGYVWPATGADANWNGAYGSGGIYRGDFVHNYYFGQLVAIPLSVNLNSLGLVTPQAQNVAKALQLYGAYTVDSGGLGFWFVIDDQAGEGLQWTRDPNYVSDINKIGAALRIVTNSFNPTNGGPPRNGVKLDGGDGTLSAPLAPSFDR